MNLTRICGATVVFAAACLAASLAAQSAPQRPSQQPTFRATTDLVQVDVVVVDAEGRHVRGLTQADFELRDRKKPQTIATFEEVSHERPPVSADPPRPVRADVASNQSSRTQRLVVMVIDDLHIYRGRTDRARDLATDVIQKLGADASMAVLFTSGDHSTEVTEDRARLLGAIDTLEGRKGWRRPHQAIDTQRAPGVDPEAPLEVTMKALYQAGLTSTQEFFDNMSQFKTLQDAARILGADQVRRKAFVMLSEGIMKSLNGIFDGEPPNPGYHDLALRQMMASLRRSNVTVYNLDPRGRVSSQDLMLESSPDVWGMLSTMDTTKDDEDQAFRWNNPVRQSQDGLQLMAEASGGFAVTDTDDFEGGIDRILEDLDHYYLLGFYPADPEGKGFRPLDVEVKRPGVTLRFRRGYEPAGPPAPPRNADPLARLVSGSLPKSELPMRLHAVPLPYSNSEARVAIAMELTVPRKSIEESDQRLLDQIRYGIYAVDLKGGKVREQFGRGARIALRPRPNAGPPPDHVTYILTASMQLPFGRYQLRASATSDKLAQGGSVFLSLDVPQFSKQPIGLSDLVIAYADGPRVPVARDTPRSVVPAANLLPFDPTLDRVFSPRDVLRVFFRAVQQKPSSLTAAISAYTAEGRQVLTIDRPLTGGNPASLDINLPLNQLAPGSYRLEVRVSGEGGVATREVGIEVR